MTERDGQAGSAEQPDEAGGGPSTGRHGAAADAAEPAGSHGASGPPGPPGASSTPVTSVEARFDPATERVDTESPESPESTERVDTESPESPEPTGRVDTESSAPDAPDEPATVPGTGTERLPGAQGATAPDAATRAIGRPETQVLDRDDAPSTPPGPGPNDALTRVAPPQTRQAPVPDLGGGARVPERSAGVEARRVVRRVLHAVASALRAVGMVCALILLVHVVLTVTAVNPANAVAAVIAELADVLVLSFRDLFLPADPVATVAVNYGLAALFWAVLGSVAGRVVRALAAVLR